MGFASTGIILFKSTGESIGPDTTLTDFERMRLAAAAHRHMGGGRAVCRVGVQPILDAPFHVTLHFDHDRLDFIELMADNAAAPQPGAWNEWTIENERARKAWHEDWIRRVFGQPAAPAPIVASGLPDPIVPAMIDADTPMQLVLPWGEIGSFMDTRSGYAWLRVSYKR